MKKTLKIRAYYAVISCDWLGENSEVTLGVIENEQDNENWWDNDLWIDQQIYYYFTPEDMENLKAGDIYNDGEDFKIVSIDKQNPTIYAIEYEI